MRLENGDVERRCSAPEKWNQTGETCKRSGGEVFFPLNNRGRTSPSSPTSS